MENTLNSYYEYIGGMSEGSVVQYKNILNRLYRYLNRLEIDGWDRVSTEHLANYQVYLRREGGKRGGPLQPATQNQHAACIRAFFRYLNNIKGIKNEAAFIVFDKLHVEEGLIYPLTPEELRTLRNACGENILYRTIVLTMFSTGMRRTELTSCPLLALSLDNGEITIRGKGRHVRKVLLLPEVIQALKEYLIWRNSKANEGVDTLFVSTRGKPITYNQLSYIFIVLRRYVPRIHPHLLRHTFATYLLNSGSTLKEVQEQLGHKRISTTGRYLHVTEEVKRKHGKLSEYLYETKRSR